MKIQPIQKQLAFKMKWKQSQLETLTRTRINLDNGNTLTIRQTADYKLQSLYNKVGEWVKSKLRYYKGRQVIREIRSYNNANQMD